ncbi:MAG TPA: shikimate dehydrogenase [Solirubrobacteraceae bacterium]|nr:shikimate dehydrogenase [Solirubrobacteraceae bacterium]
MPRLGVIGWPVRHSRSPAMFAAAFAACEMEDWSYQRLPIAPDLFEQTVRALGATGFHGANVTIPHKQSALAIADRASEAARAIGAANTLTFAADGSIAAENTDAPGLLAAIGESVTGRSALVLGAGGSARAAVWALLGTGAEVSVWNRTPERAVALAEELGARATPHPTAADLLVNCTSVGLQRLPSEAEALNQLAIGADLVGSYACVIDLVYRDGQTPLLAAAAATGARTVDGLEVLVAQGALSFQSWTGRAAPLQAMRQGACIAT